MRPAFQSAIRGSGSISFDGAAAPSPRSWAFRDEGVAAPIKLSHSAIRNRPSAILGGFTLVEVLMALCIFAMAAVVLGASYVNVLYSYEVVSRGMRTNEDFAFARSLVVTQPDRTKLEQGGEFDTAGGGRARWSVEIEQSTVADVFKVIFSCEISEPNSLELQKMTQTFMLLRPTWSTDLAERDKLREQAKARILEFQGKQQK